MLAFEEYNGIQDCCVSYMKNFFKPMWILLHGPPSYNSELKSDNCFKFLMDVLRRCLMNGNPEKVSYLNSLPPSPPSLPPLPPLPNVQILANFENKILPPPLTHRL